MTTILDTLKAAKARISDPHHWTQRAIARNQDWKLVPANSFDAVCWCAFGAVVAESKDTGWCRPVDALEKAADKLFRTPLIPVNDQLGHTAVMQVYDHAIASEEAAKP